MNHIVKHAVVTSLCVLSSLSMLQPIAWLFPSSGDIIPPTAAISGKTRNRLEALLDRQDYSKMLELLSKIPGEESIEWNEEIAHAGHAIGWYNLLKHLSASSFSHGKPEAIAQGLSYVIILEILTKMALCCRIADVAPEDCIDTWKDILSLKAKQYFFDKINKKNLKSKIYKRAIEIAEKYFKVGLQGDFVATLPHSVWVNKIVWASKEGWAPWVYASNAITWLKPKKENYALFLEFLKNNPAAAEDAKREIQERRDNVYLETVDAYQEILKELKIKEGKEASNEEE